MSSDLRMILHDGNHSLVVQSAGVVRTFDGRGVADLFRLLAEEPEILRGASVADKVVGKGAAALMIAGGVSSLYAEVISAPALDLLSGSCVKVNFGRSVANIINHRADGICPVESLCLPVNTAQECVPLIARFLSNQNSRPV